MLRGLSRSPFSRDSDEECCWKLQQNDPGLTSVNIRALDNRKALRYRHALQNNSVVEAMRIWTLSELTLDDVYFDGLLDFIATSKSLKTFVLRIMYNVHVVGLFLSAASRSSSIKEITLGEVVIPSDSLERLLCRTKSLTIFIMRSTTIQESNGVSKKQALAAFSQNKSIVKLSLGNVEESLLIPLFSQLNLNTNIKELSIASLSVEHLRMSVVLSESIQQLLTESATLQTIEFRRYDFQASTFSLLSTGLKRSRCLQKLVLAGCRFDEESTELFRSIYQYPELKMRSLELSGPTQFQNDHLPSVISEIIGTSKMTFVGIHSFFFLHQDIRDLTYLLRPLEQDSTLECLHLCRLSNENFGVLLSSIPKLRGLAAIGFGFADDVDSANAVKLMIQVLKKNMSLKGVECNSRFIGEDDHIEMQRYCVRNIYIHQWIAEPDAVPASLWQYIFEAAHDYEYRTDVVFRGLMALGDRV
jgi:hypothetical protein